MSTFALMYEIVSAALLLLLIFLDVKLILSKENSFKSLIFTISLGIGAVIANCFLMADTTSQHIAMGLETIYFILTVYLAMSMLYYVLYYVESKKNTAKTVCFIILGVLSVADTVCLLVNVRTQMFFTLTPSYFEALNLFYWSLQIQPLHWIHLGFCYVMVGSTFVILFLYTIKTPSFYKRKYLSIFISYAVVIALNFYCYMTSFPIDVSVLMYAVLALFVTYYSTFSYPRRLLSYMLGNLNKTINDALIYYDDMGNCVFANNKAIDLFSQESPYSKKKLELYRQKWLENHAEAEIHLSVLTDSEVFIYQNMERRFMVEYQELVYQEKNAGEVKVIGSFFKLSDKTDEINSFMRQRFIATHDPLTGVYNREHFFKKAEQYLKDDPYSEKVMLCSNIKDFKLVNELFGVETGDLVLKKQAELLRRFCHKEDVYGRIGDDKYGLLLKKEFFDKDLFLSSIDTMCRLAENSTYKMHIVIGVCEVKNTLDSPQILYDKAKMAADALKNDYQKVFIYYDSNLMEKVLAEKNVISDFNKALENKEFKLYLQPLVTQNEKVVGAEALVRWHHPVRGIMNPSSFIEVLENTALIQKLDLYMWEECVRSLKAWTDRGIKDFYISINVSAKDVYYLDVYGALTSLIEKYGISPDQLKIEFTEELLTDDFEKSQQLFKKLQDYGFKIAIDKFGSGYSSLNLLKDINADILKTDLAFLQESENLGRNRIILSSIINMSKSLDMQVITQGVETAEQLKVVSELNSDLYQGFYFSRPLTAGEFDQKFLSN